MTTTTTPSDSEKLEPCPFCGSPDVSMSFFATPDSGNEPAGHFIECESCAASGEGVRIQGDAPDRAEYAKSKAITAWNTRTPDSDREQGGVGEDWIRGLIGEAVVMSADDVEEGGEENCRIAEAVLIAIRPYLAALTTQPVPVDASAAKGFQDRCGEWLDVCFGPESRLNVQHRNARFLEEAAELVQASGMVETAALDVVRYVYSRPQGEINQEVGGVMMTLAAHCLATGVDMTAEGERELARVWTKVDKIRTKEAAKPTFAAPAPDSGSLSPASGWRGIETVPTDNSRVLLWVTGRMLPGPRFGSAYSCEGRVVAKPEGGNGDWTADITHWQPLPLPPANSKEPG